MPATVTGSTVGLQCVASVAGTLAGETLGGSLTAKLAAGLIGALIGAFLTAPGRHRRRRIVAVALLLALLDMLRQAAGALAAERRQEPRAWVPANWAVVGATAAVGLVGGSLVTTVRGAWANEKTPAFVSVPQVRGEPRVRAVALLAGAHLRVATTTEPSESVASGAATRTEPVAGAHVERDAAVTLFVSSGSPAATVKVPDVTGLERSAARTLVVDTGLRPRLREEPSTSIARDHATRTAPPAGARVRRGGRVTLLVSSGPPSTGRVTIPDVRGEPRASALARLREAGLHPRPADEPSEDVPEGSATRTDPASGTSVEPGATVTVFVSSGRPVTRVKVPDLSGSSLADARAALDGLGLELRPTTESSAAVAEGIVIRTKPVAGTLVDPGSPVGVVVSSGPPPLTVPPLAGQSSAAAAEELKSIGLGATESDESSTTVPSGVVIGTEPAAGTVVHPGDVVNLVVSCDSACNG